MSLTDKDTYAGAFGTRQLTVRESLTLAEGTTINVINTERDKREGATLTKADAVRLAKSILRRLEPDALVPERFKLSEAVGQFVSNGSYVRKVVGPAEGYDKANEYMDATDAHGTTHTIYNTPTDEYWSPVEVEVTTHEVWTVKD